MHFNHYGGEAARLAADLVNTPDEGCTPVILEPILAAHGIVDRKLNTTQAAQLKRWRADLARCFGPQDLRKRCERINALLTESASTPYISLHDGTPHLHYSSPGADAAAHIRAVTAAGLAYITCFGGPNRLGRCARTECFTAFVDTSRNGRRTYCTVRCANNAAVTRHRDRTARATRR
jgi:predicted RNA-binding Zn ribbon-like protein